MIYDDGTGPPIYVPLSGRRPPPDGVPEPESISAVYEAIVRVATDHPRWGPRRIYSELRRTRHDIPLAAVETVVEELQRTPQDRGNFRS